MDLRERAREAVCMPFRTIKSKLETSNQKRLARLDNILLDSTIDSLDLLYGFPNIIDTSVRSWQLLNTQVPKKKRYPDSYLERYFNSISERDRDEFTNNLLDRAVNNVLNRIHDPALRAQAHLQSLQNSSEALKAMVVVSAPEEEQAKIKKRLFYVSQKLKQIQPAAK